MSKAAVVKRTGSARDHEAQSFESGAGIQIKDLHDPADMGNFESELRHLLARQADAA